MTKVAERSKPVYAACVYHDSETDAAVRDKSLGYFPSLSSAVTAVNEVRGDYWQTGGVVYGYLFPAVLGRRPERFESDERESSWFVGTDGKPDR